MSLSYSERDTWQVIRTAEAKADESAEPEKPQPKPTKWFLEYKWREALAILRDAKCRVSRAQFHVSVAYKEYVKAYNQYAGARVYLSHLKEQPNQDDAEIIFQHQEVDGHLMALAEAESELTRTKIGLAVAEMALADARAKIARAKKALDASAH